MFAKVVVDVRSSNVDIMYTYLIPEKFIDYIFIGSRVLVNFNLREILGYVIEISDATDYSGKIKEIIDVFDFDKQLTQEQIELALKISQETKSLLVSSLDLMYPAFLKTKYRKYLKIINFEALDANIALLFKEKDKIILDSNLLNVIPGINKEVKKGNLEIIYDNYHYGKNKYTNKYSYNEEKEVDFDSLTTKRKRIVNFLKANESKDINEISTACDCSYFLIKDLVKKGFLNVKKELVIEKEEKSFFRPNIKYSFNENEIKNKFITNSKKPYLFVTNDLEFRDKFLLDIISEVLLNNKQVMVVTKSILQSFEVSNFLESHLFNAVIYNFNSSVPTSEYFDNYMQVKHQNVDIVVTTMSGIFLPLEKMGLAIMYEENDISYISEKTPKYSSLEVLKHRADYNNAKLIFVNEAICVENYYQYYINKYTFLAYFVDYNKEYHLVNMRNEYIKPSSLMSTLLKDKINQMLNNNKISFLILNQKNYSETISCKKCSSVLKCPNCLVSLSFNKDKNEARCHYCGYSINHQELTCKTCGSHDFALFNLGLEKLNEEIMELFPNKRIIQIDSEAVNNQNEYDQMVISIEENQEQIVIGTNILLDLLDYDHIGLVALVNADNILNNSDYRSSQILYQNISKVINRKNIIGIFQGYNLEHYSVVDAIKGDFFSFFNKEMEFRNNLKYPPKYDIMRLIILGPFQDMYHAAYYFRKVYRSILDKESDILGPVYLKRYKGVQLVLKTNEFEKISRLIDEVEKKFTPKNVTFNFERHPKLFY